MKYIPLQFNQIHRFKKNDFAIAIDLEFHSGSILIQYEVEFPKSVPEPLLQ